jgi:peptide/nickel transport system substrate-binding protein
VHHSHRSARRRPGVVVVAALAAFGLIAAACGDKKDDTVTPVGTDVPAAETTAAAAGDTATTAGAAEEEATTTAAPAEKPVPGGKLIVSGEAEVANPWTPAAMQCDSYCQQRARTFFDPLGALGVDNKVHPYLAESITPNDDFTIWTIKLRSGIKFHDGTDLNAEAAIKNLQLAGAGFLLSKALIDVAKNPDGTFKIEATDDLTFDIYTGNGGDPAQPLPWPNFDIFLTGQWAFIASPTWLDATVADPSLASKPVGTGPFVFDSYVPNDKLVVKKNPSYWQTDADGNALPYLDEIEFRVINDAVTAQKALESGDLNITATSIGQVIAEFRGRADEFPMQEQQEYGETNYLLLNLAKEGTALTDQRVRCALSKAINRQELIDAINGGILTPANGPFSPGQQGNLEDNGFNIEQDIEGAKALIDEYKAETGASEVRVIFGRVPDALLDTAAELYKGWWDQIGVTTEVLTVEQSALITNALLGIPEFEIYSWRNNAGIYVDQQHIWWHSDTAPPPGQLALNFGRLRDPVIDGLLDEARSETDAAALTTIAEDINRQFAKECWIIPTSWTVWGVPHDPSVQGLGATMLPDGSGVALRDGAGFPGSYWTTSLWIKN